jgi:hypothetical protein
MLEELKAMRLEVIKLPSKEGGYIRVAVSVNCNWYKELCSMYLRSYKRRPKPRTIIRRQHTVKALQRMLKGDKTTVYAQRILPIAETLEWES